MDLAFAIVFIGLITFLGYFLAFLFEKTKIPEVLPLFLLGILIGPVGGFIDLSFFGELGEIFATLVLLLILFEGGIDIHIRELLRSFYRSTLLVVSTISSTVLIVAFLAYVFFQVPLAAGALIGIIVGGTSAAIVMPLVKNLRLREETQTTMSVESNLNDVLTVILVFGLIGVLEFRTFEANALLNEFLLAVLGSFVIGVASAYLWSHAIEKIRTVKHNIFTTPAFLLLVFSAGEFFAGNGFLAAFIFAITLGNLEHIQLKLPSLFGGAHNFAFTREERKFFSATSFLLKTFFFVYIGISLNIQNMAFLVWGAVIMAILLAARVFLVRAILGESVPKRDLMLVSGILPKGTAGIAILAIIGDRLLQDLSYPIILFSIIYTSIFVFVAQRFVPSPPASAEEQQLAAPPPRP